MDDQLKQRLLGATIVVALAVIFIPMLFDEKGPDGGGITATNIPPLPSEAREREITLPAMPDEAKPEDGASGAAGTGEDAGYRIIPLDEPSIARQDKAPAVDPAERDKAKSEQPVEFGADEGGPTDELPTRDSPLAKLPRAAGAASNESRGHAGSAEKSATPKAPAPKEPRPAALPEERGSVGPAKTKRPDGMDARKPDKPPGSPRPAADAKERAIPAPTRKDDSDGTAGSKPTKPVEAAKSGDAGRTPSPASVKSVPAVAPADRRPVGTVRYSPAERETAEVAKPASSKSERSSESTPDIAPKKSPEVAPLASAAPAPAAAVPAKSSPKRAPEPKPAPASSSATKSAAGSSTWVVRAATFTSESNAKALAEKLKKQKFAAYVQKVTGEKGTVYRVQVGPGSDKNRAEQTRKRLETSAGVQGVLVSHR